MPIIASHQADAPVVFDGETRSWQAIVAPAGTPAHHKHNPNRRHHVQ